MLRLSQPDDAVPRTKSDCGPGSSTQAGRMRICSAASTSAVEVDAGNEETVGPPVLVDGAAEMPPISIHGFAMYTSSDNGAMDGDKNRGVEATEGDGCGVVLAEDSATTTESARKLTLLLPPFVIDTEGMRFTSTSVVAGPARDVAVDL